MSKHRLPRRRSALASLCVAALAVAAASVVLFTVPQSAAAATRGQVLSSAYAYGRDRGYHVGIAVLDTKTGVTYHAGDHAGTFASESVVKVMIATRVYLQGRLKGTTAKRVYKMITQSDDQIASNLYGGVGGDHLITWIKKRFNLPHLGSEPRRAGWWGNTHITPDGMVALYGKLKAMPTWGAWLRNAMHHATKYGSDGFYQWFGLKSANAGAAIKQGWGTDYDNWGAGADENTTGYVNGDRYAVAILARGPAKTYGKPIGSMLTAAAKRLLPGGVFPAPNPVLTSASRRHAGVGGRQSVTLHGRDLTGASWVYVGTARVRPTRVTASSLQFVTPQHTAGSVRLRLATSHGTSSSSGPILTFGPLPTVTGLSEVYGRAGDTVTVTGTNFVGSALQVVFGATRVRAHPVNSRTMTVVVPKGAVGTRLTVRPATWFGTAATGPVFTYGSPPPPPTPPATTTPAPTTTPPAPGTPSETTGSPSSTPSTSPATPTGTVTTGP